MNPRTKFASVALKQFALLEIKDKRKLKIFGKKLTKNHTYACNYCNTCHFFAWKGNSHDYNKVKNYFRECNEDEKNSISH